MSGYAKDMQKAELVFRLILIKKKAICEGHLANLKLPVAIVYMQSLLSLRITVYSHVGTSELKS